MSLELKELMAWTFVQEVATPDDVQKRLIEGEVAWATYRTIRDTATITNKRLIIADRQGITCNTVEVYTLPFSSVLMYSTENAHGILDWNAELQMWTKVGMFKLKLQKGIDVAKLDWLLAHAILS